MAEWKEVWLEQFRESVVNTLHLTAEDNKN